MSELALLLAEAHRSGTRIKALPSELVPQSLDDCVAIQEAIMQTLGVQVGGWKVGPLVNGEASFGAIFAHDVLMDGTPIRLAPDHSVGIEPEVAFLLGEDLPPEGRPYQVGNVVDRIERTLAVFDLAESRLEAYGAQPLLTKVADGLASGTLVCGSGTDLDARSLDFGAILATIRVNGEIVHEMRGGKPGTQPLAALLSLANSRHLARGLKKGQIVTTGSWIPPRSPHRGERVELQFEKVGVAHVQFML